MPRTLSFGFWAGLWGVAYAVLEPWLTARVGRWFGGIAFGLAGPLLAFWFIVLPLKGLGIAGGFDAAAVLIHVGFHAVFGIGVALIFWLSLARAQKPRRLSPEALHG